MCKAHSRAKCYRANFSLGAMAPVGNGKSMVATLKCGAQGRFIAMTESTKITLNIEKVLS